jgi:peptidyl-prolyl cis-trans isomerase C
MKSSPPLTRLLTLSLCLVLTGLTGCSRGSLAEQAAAGGGASSQGSGSAAKAGLAANAAGGGAAAPAAAGQPAKPGATAGASGTPASPASGQAAKPDAAPAAEAAPLPPEKLPAVVAKVNGEEIKKDDLVRAARELQGRMQQGGASGTLNAAFYRQVLDSIIARTLLEQEAKKEGVAVSDDEVKAQLAELRGNFPSAEAFDKALKEQGLTEAELTRQARNAFTIQKFIDSKVTSDVKVSDQDAKDFYAKNQDKMKRPERVHLRHILIRVDAAAKPEDKKKAREKADAILVKLKAGEDFAKLARESSEDPGSKDSGGDLSWVARGQTVPPFEQAAFALKKPNELSPVVESNFGYHVIQLVEHQDAGVAPFDEVKTPISNFLSNKQKQERVQQRIQALRGQGKVEVFI